MVGWDQWEEREVVVIGDQLEVGWMETKWLKRKWEEEEVMVVVVALECRGRKWSWEDDY